MLPVASTLSVGWRRLWQGQTPAGAYRAFAIALSLIVLMRTTEWSPGQWVTLDGHGWLRSGGALSIEDWPGVDAARLPRLESPLVGFAPSLGVGVERFLVVARTLLALTLLFGRGGRAVPLALSLVGYALMASDRYRYLHHLHLLWQSCLLLSLAPPPAAGRSWRAPFGGWREPVARWPLQILRFQALVVYASAGLAKLDAAWLSGRTLAAQSQVGLFGGAVWESLSSAVGLSALAWAAALVELCLVPLLCCARTRPWGLALAVSLHLLISLTAVVSSFTLQMLALLALFAASGTSERDPRTFFPCPAWADPRLSRGCEWIVRLPRLLRQWRPLAAVGSRRFPLRPARRPP